MSARPMRPITVRKLKEILRLKYQAQLAHRQIALSLHISPSTVSYYLNRAAQLGIQAWPLDALWDDVSLARAFINTRVTPNPHLKPIPNWAKLHQELKKPGQKGVTLELLWQEYAERHPGSHYSYNHFCRLYKAWAALLQPSMRQTHIAGEKLFVDYCGQTMPLSIRIPARSFTGPRSLSPCWGPPTTPLPRPPAPSSSMTG